MRMYRKLLNISLFSILLFNINGSALASAIDPIDQATYDLNDSPQLRAKFARLLDLNQWPQDGVPSFLTQKEEHPMPVVIHVYPEADSTLTKVTRPTVGVLNSVKSALVQFLDFKSLSNCATICKNFNTQANIRGWKMPHGIDQTHKEAIFQTFLKGTLIYADPVSQEQIRLKISDFPNPLDGKFNLSQCGDAQKYLTISTGYRKGINPTNVGKTEIWITPRFFVEKNTATTATHLAPIMANWNETVAPIGVFFTWSSDGNEDFDYNTVYGLDDLTSNNLLKIWRRRACHGASMPFERVSLYLYVCDTFSICF